MHIHDLRSAIEMVRHSGHEITKVTRPIDPDVELVEDYLASYRRADGSWLVDEQPVRLYENPARGRFPVVMGLFGSRRLCRLFLDPHGNHAADTTDARVLMRAVENPIAPRELAHARAARSVIERPDLLKLLPVLGYGPSDPGATITLGLVYARDSRTGAGNCSFHRVTVKEHSVAVGISPKGHLQQMIDAHVSRGERLPVSINIGLDPAVYLASVLSKPSVEFGFDELCAAGGVRGRPVEIAPCFLNEGWFIDHAEITIEGTLGADQEFESPFPDGWSMPEYLGYSSPCGMVSTLNVQAATYRPNALYQSLSGPGMEQSALLGIGQECAVFGRLAAWNTLDLVRSVASLPSGGGHLMTVLQVSKQSAQDDATAVALAKTLLREVGSLKNLILVDEDVNASSAGDVLWAMATRCRLDVDVHVSEELAGTPLDPSQLGFYVQNGRDGFTKKCVVDCTSPYAHRDRFRRAFNAHS